MNRHISKPFQQIISSNRFRNWNKNITRLKDRQSLVNVINKNINNDECLELTLAIIKPHVCNDPIKLNKIKTIMLNNDFLFIKSTRTHMTRQQAELFYNEHREKFFFDRLVSLMISGDISVHVLAKVNAIKEWRRLMGPTKVFRTQLEFPNTIRGIFGLTDTRNATHGSDSPENAKREIEFFFPDFSTQNWFQNEESKWRTHHRIIFDRKQWIHRLI